MSVVTNVAALGTGRTLAHTDQQLSASMRRLSTGLRISSAIDWISTVRGHLGATENRLTHTIAGLGTTIENLTAAQSRIRDADMAQETAALARHQVLAQAGTAMLGQAHPSARSVLSLLG